MGFFDENHCRIKNLRRKIFSSQIFLVTNGIFVAHLKFATIFCSSQILRWKYFRGKFCHEINFHHKISMKFIFVEKLIANFATIFAINFYMLQILRRISIFCRKILQLICNEKNFVVNFMANYFCNEFIFEIYRKFHWNWDFFKV